MRVLNAVPVTVLIALTFLSASAQAQTNYPSRPVRVIVPFPPGAGLDIIARIVTPKMSESLGQPFVVDNRAGAGGILGTELAARSPADGHHLLVTGNVAIQTLVGKVSYRVADFAPVSMLASVPNVLVVSPALAVKSIDELVTLARAKPRYINFASTGTWTTPHLIGALFMQEAKIQLVHVPYKGSAPAITDLLGGQVHMFFSNMLSAIPHVRNGKLRALAVTSASRSPTLQHVPTVAESGYPGFEADTTFGLWVPAGVPKPIAGRLHGEVVKALARPDALEQLASQGAAAMGKGPEEYGAYLRTSTEKWQRVISAMKKE